MQEPPEAIVRDYPHLPEELWRRIALLLPLQDWVKASSTCAALHQLTLDTIEIETRDTLDSELPPLLWLNQVVRCDLQ